MNPSSRIFQDAPLWARVPIKHGLQLAAFGVKIQSHSLPFPIGYTLGRVHGAYGTARRMHWLRVVTTLEVGKCSRLKLLCVYMLFKAVEYEWYLYAVAGDGTKQSIGKLFAEISNLPVSS